ncbi:MAG: ParA family protein [Xanthobacteraceae bacterium]|nr:ParA family protein [Xanthobacteraceae bacterium]
MNVIVVASRKGGSGKSTLTAHLAAHVHKPSRPCLLVDSDPQGSLTLWHGLRGTGEPVLKSGLRGVENILKAARNDYEWAFVDTPPTISAVVTEAIRCATLVVIPARPTVFDLSAVKETIDLCRSVRKPYAVVINAAPTKRDDSESPIVTQAREGLAKLRVPVWGGQITQRTNFSIALGAGEGVKEYDSQSAAAGEMARLWTAIEKSVKAIHGASVGTVMHKHAA